MQKPATTHAPEVYHFYNKAGERCATESPLVRRSPVAVVTARYKANGKPLFEVHRDVASMCRYIRSLPANQQCEYAVARPGVPVEQYVDAEIEAKHMRSVQGAPPHLQGEELFDTQMQLTALWLTLNTEALFGVSCEQRGRTMWMFRADTPTKYSCHMHVPQWVYTSNEHQAAAMRVLEDVLYYEAGRPDMPLSVALMLRYNVEGRANRRRPAIEFPEAHELVVSTSREHELVIDSGVFSAVRQLRMPLQCSNPKKSNPLRLRDPPCRLDLSTALPQSGALLTPDSSYTSSTLLTAGDLLMRGLIATPHAVHRVPMPSLVDTANRMLDEQCQSIARACGAAFVHATGGAREFKAAVQPALAESLRHLWNVYMPLAATAGGSNEPRFAPHNLEHFVQELVRTLASAVTYARESQQHRAAAAAAAAAAVTGSGTLRELTETCTYRLAFFALLMVRYRLPASTRVLPLDTTRVLHTIQTHLLPAYKTNIDSGSVHLFSESIALCAALYGHHCAVLGTLSVDASPAHAAYSRRFALGNVHAVHPTSLFEIVACTFRLELCARYVAQAQHALRTNADMQRFLSLEWLTPSDIDSDGLVIDALVTAVRRGALWQPVVTSMVSWLGKHKVSGATRFGDAAAVAVPPTDAVEAPSLSAQLTLGDLGMGKLARVCGAVLAMPPAQPGTALPSSAVALANATTAGLPISVGPRSVFTVPAIHLLVGCPASVTHFRHEQEGYTHSLDPNVFAFSATSTPIAQSSSSSHPQQPQPQP